MAAGLADELKKNFGVEPELVRGAHGIFDVIADGKTIYSKDETGRFPDPGEVSSIMKKAIR
jgi:predicted Rdx family selenoprotein